MDGLQAAFREQAFNRKARRKLGRVILPNGRLSPIALELLKHGREELLAKLAAEFPLSERFFQEDLMLKFAKGAISEQALTEEFAIVFRDVERFVAWTFDRYDPNKKLIKWLREFGNDQISMIEKIRLDLASVQHSYGQTSKEMNRCIDDLDVQANIMKARRKLLDGIWHDQQAMLRNLGVNQLEWERLLCSELGMVPSLDAFAMALKEYIKRSVRISPLPRKLKTSDVGDLFHLFHIPYCDIFRADGDTAESAKPLGKAFDTRIVGKLHDLTAVIDSELKVREKLT